jgi:hypothetical protein
MITINGSIFSGDVSGSSLVVMNGKVFVNGKEVTPDGKEINIVVQGNIEKLEVGACSKITITGDVNDVKTQSADVEISGHVNGNIQTMSGDVDCGNVGGSIKTMSGDVKHKK